MKPKTDQKNQKLPNLVARLVDKSGVVYQLQELVWEVAKKFDKNLKVEDVHIEHPDNPEHGDYSSNIAMILAKRLKKKPLDLARLIVKELKDNLPTQFHLAVRQLAEHTSEVSRQPYLDKVEAVSPGFINFWLSEEFLLNALVEPVKLKEKYGSSQILKGKKILIEHTSPNPQTTIMIGHLRNNFLGMTTAGLLEFLGSKVVRDCIVNDRGVHISRAMWGYLVFAKKDSGLSVDELNNFREINDQKVKEIIGKADWKKLIVNWAKNESVWLVPTDLKLKSDHFNLVSYVLGSRAYSLSDRIKKQVGEMLLAWEAGDKNVWRLWRRILKDWSAKGYEETYKRVGSVHDWVWHESQLYKEGKKIVMDGLKKGIFRKSKGVIVTNLSKYNLPDTVLIKSDGAALYHTFDLNLTLQKRKKFPSDLYIWDIGVEQTLYLKQLYAMCEQLGFGTLADDFHLSYNHVNFRGGGKMSTRRGTVIPADELLDKLHKKARKIIETSVQELRGKLSEKEKEKIAEEVGLAAAKYGMLKYTRETTIYFDINESLSLEGNSGPYLQYSYARARSVLRKAGKFHLGGAAKFHLAGVPPPGGSPSEVGREELAILRTIYQFPEVVLEAAKNFAPNIICNFLFDLAQKFNAFYNQCPILKPKKAKDTLKVRFVGKDTWKVGSAKGGLSSPTGEDLTFQVESVRNFRLLLTASVAQVLKNGLTLLGIETLERM